MEQKPQKLKCTCGESAAVKGMCMKCYGKQYRILKGITKSRELHNRLPNNVIAIYKHTNRGGRHLNCNSSKLFKAGERYACKVSHDRIVFELANIFTQGKTHLMSPVKAICIIAPDVVIGRYLICEEESSEDKIVIYFEDILKDDNDDDTP